MSDSLTKLRALEASGNYLFHGSGAAIEKFEPRQAHTYRDGAQIPDGLPAIFASPILDCAIFRALFSQANFPHGSHSAWSWSGSNTITYKATKKSLAELRDDMQGYIYVFDRAGFTKKNMTDWMCHEPIAPAMTFTVTRADFAPTIHEMVDD